MKDAIIVNFWVDKIVKRDRDSPHGALFILEKLSTIEVKVINFFTLLSVFNVISNFVGYLMPNIHYSTEC